MVIGLDRPPSPAPTRRRCRRPTIVLALSTWRRTSSGRRVVRQRNVVIVEPADHRSLGRPLAGATAIEPEASTMLRRDRTEERHRIGHGRLPESGPRKFAIIRAPCSDRMDSGWNCTPSRGSVACRTPCTTPSSERAVTISGSGHLDGLKRVIPDRGERRAADPRKTPSPSWLMVATDPWAGSPRATFPPYAVTRPCMPRQTPKTGRAPERRTSRPMAKSDSLSGCPGPGESTTWE